MHCHSRRLVKPVSGAVALGMQLGAVTLPLVVGVRWFRAARR
jgi:hypothetical protein